MKLPLFILIISIFLQTSLATTLTQGEIEHYHGREIKIVAIEESQVIIGVDDEKAIFSVGQEKEINGVKIKVEEIFYANELSTIDLNLTLAYECGDEICSEFESPKNCCSDCSCEEDKQCVDNTCILPECFNNIDCNDNNNLTEDKCEDYKCEYKMIKCKEDSDCDDLDPDTDDFCSNERCRNIQNYVCKQDIDCDDQNECTQDSCINKDCQYKILENCEQKVLPKKEAEEITNLTQEEKIGFFRRLLNWIKNLF